MTLTQDQDHGFRIAKISVRAISPYPLGGSGEYFTLLLSMVRVCHDLDPKVKSPSSMSQYKYIQSLCPGHYSLQSSWIRKIFLTILTILLSNPKVCHDLDPMSYFQGQDHSAQSQCAHPQNLCRSHNSLLSCRIWIIFPIIFVCDPRVFHLSKP